MIAALAARYWQIIVGGLVAVVLLTALLATRATLAECKAERETAQTKLSVSNASLGRLEAEISRMLGEQQELAASDAERIAASRETLAVAEAASRVRMAARDRLLASAEMIRPEVPTPPECEVSATLEEIWPS